MNERDETRLADMLDMARKAKEFLNGKSEDLMRKDEILSFALVRTLEVIGEAASKIQPETRKSLPQIPWSDIVGLRHRVIHEYENVDYHTVWMTIVNDIPPLIAQLEKIVPLSEQYNDDNDD